MARAKVIFIAARKDNSAPVRAAFTVKKELIAWLEARTVLELAKLWVYRLADGDPAGSNVSITKADLFILNSRGTDD